ncbi:hypothetical protein F4777DRAFT_594299 [Nemania sp. FL0916]|nr:hypothetical protein F4777DRAFT_594299 [Nemania sp. FL0916]
MAAPTLGKRCKSVITRILDFPEGLHFAEEYVLCFRSIIEAEPEELPQDVTDLSIRNVSVVVNVSERSEDLRRYSCAERRVRIWPVEVRVPVIRDGQTVLSAGIYWLMYAWWGNWPTMKIKFEYSWQRDGVDYYVREVLENLSFVEESYMSMMLGPYIDNKSANFLRDLYEAGNPNKSGNWRDFIDMVLAEDSYFIACWARDRTIERSNMVQFTGQGFHELLDNMMNKKYRKRYDRGEGTSTGIRRSSARRPF